MQNTNAQNPTRAGIVTASKSWPYYFSYFLTYLINPLILPPILFGLVLRHFGAPSKEIDWIVLIGLVFFFVVPLSYMASLVWRARTASLEIRNREHRTGPFLVSIASYLVSLGLIYTTGTTAVRLLMALVACYAFNTLVLMLINLHWKISLHTSGLAGFVAMLLFVAHVEWPSQATSPGFLHFHISALYLLLLMIPLMMWIRVHLEAHTWGQVTAGAVFGLCVPYAELYLLLQLQVLPGIWLG